MGFTQQQLTYLSADLNRAHVKSRSQAGRSLSYLEGWHVIAEANRIFGFDGWQSETVDLRVTFDGPRNGKHQVSYVARVRVTVFAGDRTIVREGVGAGHGIDMDAGQCHEKAIKEAETDARKRALMTFGNPMGLALYDKEQAAVSNGPVEVTAAAPAPVREPAPPAPAPAPQSISQRATAATQPPRAQPAMSAPAATRTAPAAPQNPVEAASAKLLQELLDALRETDTLSGIDKWTTWARPQTARLTDRHRTALTEARKVHRDRIYRENTVAA